jgi:hypothetical protein
VTAFCPSGRALHYNRGMVAGAIVVSHASRRRWAAGLAAFLAALGALAALGGCASAPALVAPRIEVANLAALPSSTEMQRFRVTLVVDNTNTEPLVVNELRFMLRLASEGRLNGTSQGPFTLQPLDRSTHSFTVETDILSSLSRLVAVQGPGGGIPYELVGDLMLDRSFKNSLPFSARGEVSLSMSAADR